MKSVTVEKTLQNSHSLINEVVLDTASELNGSLFVVKIDDLLEKRGLSQKDLASMTGIRVGTISEWVNGKNLSINKVQLLAIMGALRCVDITEILEIRIPQPLLDKFIAEAREWEDTRHMPDAVRELYKNNLIKSAGL